MIRTTALLFLACALPTAAAQDIPGVTTSLVAEPALVTSAEDVKLRLVVEVSEAAELPSELLNGIQLDVTVNDKPGKPVRDAGKGGNVKVAAGTRIERTITVPTQQLMPAGTGDGTAVMALQWPGLTGANCTVQVVPDVSKIDVASLDLSKTKVVLVTSLGDMTLAFYPDKAPATVTNFVKLAKDGFYDGTKFHRVIRNFMIQGGDPLTKDDDMRGRWGTGDPGYKIKGEVNDTKHARGVISMANSGSPDTAGSQFFICHADAPHLNTGYTAFGALESGLDTLDKIASVPCGGPQRSAPLTDVVLERAIVLPVLKQ